MNANRKIYRIETFSRERHVTPRAQEAGREGASTDAHADQRHSAVMTELEFIKSMMKPQQDMSKQVMESFKSELLEAHKLKEEIDEISQAINETKVQIASVHNSSFDAEQMGRVANELDAITAGTETATETILAAAEMIDEKASELSAHLTGSEKQAADDITDRIVEIFEACNFQDLTGQRINKIVTTLKFVEERIDSMMQIWGGIESFRDIEVVEPPSRDGDAALLNGPALETDANLASQDDIDALFD